MSNVSPPVLSSSRLHDARNAVACALAVLLAVAATCPVAELPYNDDWSYSWTVKRLLETGHLTYNGWASASGIAQAYWGLMWVKLFGFSYTVLRLSTVPFSAGAVAIMYLLARRAGVRPRWAVFAALTLGLSPLYLPVAATFMTDAPGLFCVLFSLYAFVRAIESESPSAGIGWMIGGTIVGIVGGTSRQIVWLAPLVGLPYAGLVFRRDLKSVATAAVCGIATIASACWTVAWFDRQDYAIPEPSIAGDLVHAILHPAHFVMSVVTIGLTLVLVILPATPGLLSNLRSRKAPWIIAAGLAVAFVVVLWLRPRYGLMPWMENTLEPVGVMGASQLSGRRPVVLTMPVRVGVSVAVFGVSALVLGIAFIRLWRWRGSRAAALAWSKGVVQPPGGDHRAAIPLLTLFAVVYTLFLLPRASRDMAYDRYVLELIPCALIPLLRVCPPKRWTAVIAWTLLAVWGVYGIASTQEETALARARVRAADRVLAGGYQRGDVTVGFEYDYLTEIINHGHINDPRIRHPAGAYQDGDPTPSVQALFRVEFTAAPDTRPTVFGSVDYFSLLPPFRRTIYIDQFKNPYWRAPGYAEAHKHDHRHSMIPTDGAIKG